MPKKRQKMEEVRVSKDMDESNRFELKEEANERIS